MELRKKSAIERQQDFIDELSELVEDCNNALTLESIDIAQRYVEGWTSLYLEIRSRNTGRNFHIVLGHPRKKLSFSDPLGEIRTGLASCLIVDPIGKEFGPFFSVKTYNEMIGDVATDNDAGSLGTVGLREIVVHVHGQMASCSGADTQQDALIINTESGNLRPCVQIDRYQAGMMLIGVVEGVECVQERITGFVRFEDSDGFTDVGTQLSLFSKGGLKFTPVAAEWKRHASRRIMGLNGDGAEHLVQRTAQVMQNSANGHIQGCGNVRENITPDFDTIRIDVFDRFMQARWIGHRGSSRLVSGKFDRSEDVEIGSGLEQSTDLDLEIVDFGFGPFDLGETFSKRRFRFHDIAAFMAKTDDMQQTKALMGALVRMKPKPHEEMKIGNSKAKKPKSPAKKVKKRRG